ASAARGVRNAINGLNSRSNRSPSSILPRDGGENKFIFSTAERLCRIPFMVREPHHERDCLIVNSSIYSFALSLSKGSERIVTQSLTRERTAVGFERLERSEAIERFERPLDDDQWIVTVGDRRHLTLDAVLFAPL